MRDRIYGGTLKGDTDLCPSCTYSTIRDDDHGGRQIKCSQFGRFVATKTLECTGYYNNALPSLYDLERAAWAYIPNVGFKKYRELNEEELKQFGEE